MAQPSPIVLALQKIMSENIIDRRPEGGGDPTLQAIIKNDRRAALDAQVSRMEGPGYRGYNPAGDEIIQRALEQGKGSIPDIVNNPNDLRNLMGHGEQRNTLLMQEFLDMMNGKNLDAIGQPIPQGSEFMDYLTTTFPELGNFKVSDPETLGEEGED